MNIPIALRIRHMSPFIWLLCIWIFFFSFRTYSQQKYPCQSKKTTNDFSCQRKEVWKVLQNNDIAKALDLVAGFYERDASFAQECHAITHTIGAAAYRLFSNNRHFPLRDTSAYCAYGFYHGFLEEMIGNGKPLSDAVQFCLYVDTQLSAKRPDAYMQCFHGIGHGASNSHKQEDWGKDDVLAAGGVAVCKKVSQNIREYSNCVSGVFNGIAAFYQTHDYGLNLDLSDPYRLCRLQHGDEQHICYYNIAVSHWYLTGMDTKRTLATIDALTMDTNTKARTFQEVAVKFWKEHPTVAGQQQIIAMCRALSPLYHIPCIVGYALGMFLYGKPEEEYNVPIAFCMSDELSGDEQYACFDKLFSFIPKWYSLSKSQQICQLAPIMFREMCLQRVQKILIGGVKPSTGE